MKNLRIGLFVLTLISVYLSNAQQMYSGFVKAAGGMSAIANASVYFDGTTIGAITNEDGFFIINTESAMSGNLVIRSMGFESLIVSDYNTTGNKNQPIYYLEASTEALEEVVLTVKDPWTREKKETEFRREFLGSSQASQKCIIANLDKVRLRFNPTTKMLTASSKEPLIIINKDLGYEIQYNLIDFELGYTQRDLGYFPYAFYYAGTTFFKELNGKVSRRSRKNREEVYRGSALHFFRSLIGKKLKENDFRIAERTKGLEKVNELDPNIYFTIEEENELYKVTFGSNKIIVLYGKHQQSALNVTKSVYVDKFGNHSPPTAVVMEGMMSYKRIAELLPLNYRISSE